MEDATSKIICQIRNYKSHGANQITIPKSIIDRLNLQKGDYVEVTIRPVLRPTTEENQ